MKRKLIVGIALAMGTLTIGAISASATETCCSSGNCTDKQAVRKFTQETAALSGALKVKNSELREQYGYDGLDIGKINALEAEIRDLNGKIKLLAEKHGLPSCCLS